MFWLPAVWQPLCACARWMALLCKVVLEHRQPGQLISVGHLQDSTLLLVTACACITDVWLLGHGSSHAFLQAACSPSTLLRTCQLHDP